MKKLKYLIFTLFMFMFITCSPKAIMLSKKVIDAPADATTSVIFGNPSDIHAETVCTSGDEDVFTVSNTGIITPVADGYDLVTCTDNTGTSSSVVVVNLNKTYTQPMLDKMTKLQALTSINLNFTRDFITKTVLDYAGDPMPYAPDALYAFVVNYLNGSTNNSLYPEAFTRNSWDSITFKVGRSLYYYFPNAQPDPLAGADIRWTTDDSVTLNLVFKPFVQADADKVAAAKSKVKDIYYVDLSEIYDDTLFEDIDDINKALADESDLQSDLGEDIFYEIDARSGDCSPESAQFNGFLRLGTNETIYEAVDETTFKKVIKIPKLKEGENVVDVATKYFEDYIIGPNEQVKIEEVEAMSPGADPYYQATITPKEVTSGMGMLINFLFPKLNAAEDKVVGFSVLQLDNAVQPNPKTNDNIYLYIGICSMLLISAYFVTKTRKNN